MSQPLFVIVSDDESGGDNSIHTAVLDEMGNQKVVALSEASQFRQIPEEPKFAVVPRVSSDIFPQRSPATSRRFGIRRERRKQITFPKLKCDLCEQKFTRPTYLRKHKLQVHNISVENKYERKSKKDAAPEQSHSGEDDALNLTTTGDEVEGSKSMSAEEARVARLEKLIVKDAFVASQIAMELESLRKGEPKRPRYVCRKKYPCNVCGKPFSSPSLLERHRSVHTRERLYPCPHCPKKCAYTDERLRHIRRAHPEMADVDPSKKPHADTVFRCNICVGKKFSTKYRYMEHLRVHLNGLFECHMCHKKYAKKDNLARHLMTHTGEKKHECEYCHKRFLDAALLRSHLQVHTRDYRHKCSVCQKGFSKKKNLYNHLQSHNDDQSTYECKICWQRFVSRQERDDHEMLHVEQSDFTAKKNVSALNPRLLTVQNLGTDISTDRQQQAQSISADMSTAVSVAHQLAEFSCQNRIHAPVVPALEGINPCLTCSLCSKSFQSPEEMQLHSRLHESVPQPSQVIPQTYANPNSFVSYGMAATTPTSVYQTDLSTLCDLPDNRPQHGRFLT